MEKLRHPNARPLGSARNIIGSGPSPQLWQWYRRLSTVLTVVGFLFGLLLIANMTWRTDAAVYWLADLDHLYGGAREGGDPSYLYSPAFAQALEPLRVIPLETFVLLSRVTALMALADLARWLTLPLLFTTPVAGELLVGNIHLQLALAISFSLRWPVLWALPLLTKPTLGVGLLWFAVRGEWRSLAIALGGTSIIALVSFILAPGLWFDWIATMAGSTGRLEPELARQAVSVPLGIRSVLAAALVTWGAKANRPWTLVVATCLALPTLWIIGLSMLVGLLRPPKVPDTAATTSGPMAPASSPFTATKS